MAHLIVLVYALTALLVYFSNSSVFTVSRVTFYFNQTLEDPGLRIIMSVVLLYMTLTDISLTNFGQVRIYYSMIAPPLRRAIPTTV